MPDWLFFLDDLQAVCSAYCLTYWQTVGIWLTGFATLSAVLVSLALARRQAPRARVSAGVRIVVQPGIHRPGDRNFPQLLVIDVRNVGDRPVKIEGVGWRSPPWRKVNALQTLPPQMTGITLPHEIGDGDSVKLYISLDDPEIGWAEKFARDFLTGWPWLEVRFIRVIAWTPAGQTFVGPLEDGLQQLLLEKRRKQAKRAAAAK